MAQVETIHVKGRDRALLTIPEVCQVMNIGRSRLYMLLQGDVPALRSVHVGRSLRIPAAAIGEWLEGQSAA